MQVFNFAKQEVNVTSQKQYFTNFSEFYKFLKSYTGGN